MNTLITAHAGCESTAPNTAESLSFAARLGADALEMDVRRGSCGVLTLGHDVAGLLPLTDALSLIAQVAACGVNLDLKEPGMEADALGAVRASGFSASVVLTGSVSPSALTERITARAQAYLNLEEIVPGAPESLRAAPQRAGEILFAAAQVCRACGVSVLNVDHTLCTDAFVRAARDQCLRLSVWTPGEETDIARFLALDAANITTRRPCLALRLRGERM